MKSYQVIKLTLTLSGADTIREVWVELILVFRIFCDLEKYKLVVDIPDSWWYCCALSQHYCE